jgi:hypothetical protein
LYGSVLAVTSLGRRWLRETCASVREVTRAPAPLIERCGDETNDERVIVKLNIAHYQAMLKRDIDDEKRSTVARLLAEAEEVMATDFKEQ